MVFVKIQNFSVTDRRILADVMYESICAWVRESNGAHLKSGLNREEFCLLRPMLFNFF